MNKKIKWSVYTENGEYVDEEWIRSHSPREILDVISDLIVKNKKDVEREQSISEMYQFSQQQLLKRI